MGCVARVSIFAKKQEKREREKEMDITIKNMTKKYKEKADKKEEELIRENTFKISNRY